MTTNSIVIPRIIRIPTEVNRELVLPESLRELMLEEVPRYNLYDSL